VDTGLTDGCIPIKTAILDIAAPEGRVSPGRGKFLQCAIQTAFISKIAKVKA
jgi:hypothetical protein